MTTWDDTAQQAARALTLRYSTSFGMASRLFDADIRSDIYNIYGLVRTADEIVDTYRGVDAAQMLRNLEQETYAAIERGYSADLIVHAFQMTARRYGLDKVLIQPFFASMAMDLETPSSANKYDREKYERYIYGSAEVVGLMCLRVFVKNDVSKYKYADLESGARALGAAFQKVNFLRDLADDTGILQRKYFPELQDTILDETSKQAIIADIESNFDTAKNYIDRLPSNCRAAVGTSFWYYHELLQKLRAVPAADLISRAHGRVRISDKRKVRVLVRVLARNKAAGLFKRT